MIFLKNFFDEYRRVKYSMHVYWVWFVHAICYSYIIYVYVFTDAREKEISLAARMWVPLDILLTFNIAAYQFYYVY